MFKIIYSDDFVLAKQLKKKLKILSIYWKS